MEVRIDEKDAGELAANLGGSIKLDIIYVIWVVSFQASEYTGTSRPSEKYTERIFGCSLLSVVGVWVRNDASYVLYTHVDTL